MTTTELKKFELLEEKIARTVEKIGELNTLCLSLRQEKDDLAVQVKNLENNNIELSEKLIELDTAKQEVAENSHDKKEILKKIDRMLEKFGELQI